MDGSADRAPGYWRGVRNQIQRSRMKRFETKSDHEGASDGNRSAESRCAFNKCSKTKCHQQAASTIQAIFSNPNATPYAKLMAASVSGILKKATATRIAVRAPALAHQCGFIFKPPSKPKSTRMGRAATSVESHQWPSGSYTCVQCMIQILAGMIAGASARIEIGQNGNISGDASRGRVTNQTQRLSRGLHLLFLHFCYFLLR